MHNKVVGSVAVRHHLIKSLPLGKKAVKGFPLIQFARYHHPHGKRNQVKLFSDTAHKDPPTGPLFDHHNNTFETTTSQGKYGSTEVLNKHLLSDQIPSVQLAYDVITENTSQFDKEKSSIIILHGLFGNRQNNRTIGRELNELLGRTCTCQTSETTGNLPILGDRIISLWR